MKILEQTSKAAVLAMTLMWKRSRWWSIIQSSEMEASMRVAVFLSVLFASSLVWAQQPAAGGADATKTTMASPADIASVVARLKTERGDRTQVAGPLLKLPPYTVNIEYRTGAGNAAV